MASITKVKKRGGSVSYRARVRRDGKAISQNFDTYKEAEKWASYQEVQLGGDDYGRKELEKKTTLKDLLDWAIANIDEKSPSAKLKRINLNYWLNIKLAKNQLLCDERLPLIKGDLLKSIIEKDTAVGEWTQIHRLNALSKAWNDYCLRHSFELVNPVKPGVRPKAPPGRTRRLVGDEETRLFAAARSGTRGAWLPQVLTIALETGMRQSEIAGLKWADVRLNVDIPHVFLAMTKNGNSREVPLSDAAVTAFKSLISYQSRQDGDVVKLPAATARVLPVHTARGLAHAFEDACEDAGIEDFHFHDFRHEFISRASSIAGIQQTQIMAVVGHKTQKITLGYTHHKLEEVQKVVKLNR